MKTVRVAAAVIRHNGKIFATQRGYGESMDCFFADVISGELILREHEAARWLGPDELGSVDWLPADRLLIEKIRQSLQNDSRSAFD